MEYGYGGGEIMYLPLSYLLKGIKMCVRRKWFPRIFFSITESYRVFEDR